MNRPAFIVALLVAAPCFGEGTVAVPVPQTDRHGNLRDIAQLPDPGADCLLFWDDSQNKFVFLTMGTNLSISGTTLNASASSSGGGDSGDVDGFAADPSSNASFSASAWRSDLSLVIGTNVQAYDADLTTWAGVTPSANGQSLVAGADYSAMRTLLSLVPGTNVQAFDSDLSDLADGSLTGTKVGFADTNSDFTATDVQSAIEELVSVNGSGPNAADGKVSWTQLVGVPAGFADGSDDGSGGSSGTLNTIKGNGSAVGGSDIVTLDFSSEFGVSESPDTEINLTIDSSIARDSEVNGFFGDPSTNGSFSASAWRSDLSLDTLYQPLNAKLTSMAALVPSADQIGYFTGATSMSTTGLTSYGRSLIDDTTAAAARATLETNVRTISIVLMAPTTAASTGDGKAYIPIPASMNGGVITGVMLTAVTAGTTGTTDVQIARIRSGSPVDVLSTKLTLDSTETSSITAATPAVIDTANDDLATGDLLRVDIDAVSSTPPAGPILTIEVTK